MPTQPPARRRRLTGEAKARELAKFNVEAKYAYGPGLDSSQFIPEILDVIKAKHWRYEVVHNSVTQSVLFRYIGRLIQNIPAGFQGIQEKLVDYGFTREPLSDEAIFSLHREESSPTTGT